MKTKFGAIIVAGSGKIGGHVASKNRAGSYLRTKVTPVNPSTAAQTGVRNLLASLSQAWRGLTQAQRDSWNAAVAAYATTDIFGDLRNPSGFNLFQRLNNNLAIVGEALLESAPAPIEVPAVVVSDFLFDSSPTPVAEFATDVAIPAGFALQVFATAPLSPGVSFVKSQLRQIEVIYSPGVSPNDITASYTAKFGSFPAAGQKVFVETYLISTATGQAGVGSKASTIVL